MATLGVPSLGSVASTDVHRFGMDTELSSCRFMSSGKAYMCIGHKATLSVALPSVVSAQETHVLVKFLANFYWDISHSRSLFIQLNDCVVFRMFMAVVVA